MFRLDHDGPIARLTLDRPDARNAIPASAWGALDSLLSKVAETEARLLVLSGEGPSFCAGADLRDFADMEGDPAAASRFRVAMRAALDRLATLPFPTLASIHGPCFGAGVALALACDLRFAGAEARFAVPPAKIGLSYPQEDVHRLVSTVGAAAAARLLFSALPIGAAEAQRIGLADLIDAEGLSEIVGAIAANVPESLSTLKQAIALAGKHVRRDLQQDRLFDELASSEKLAARIAGR